jgi:charged multivesicular body protein 4
MMTVEREIFSIEAANINKETFEAMNGAKVAMKNIHGGLTIDKVDQTMEDLREQHDIGQQISEAITSGNTMQGIDEDELDEELAILQQEELDAKMLKSGSVPVSDRIHSLPNAANGTRKFHCSVYLFRTIIGKLFRDHHFPLLTNSRCCSRLKQTTETTRGRRRGGRTTETPGGNGHVNRRRPYSFPLSISHVVFLFICQYLMQLPHFDVCDFLDFLPD